MHIDCETPEINVEYLTLLVKKKTFEFDTIVNDVAHVVPKIFSLVLTKLEQVTTTRVKEANSTELSGGLS